MPKALIVDDSALMRRHLREILEGKGGFEVMAVRNGIEALEALDSFDPDVITLDINMPGMDGITCLSNIMVRRPKPVVMVSSLTERGAEATFEALALGAVDFVHKPDGTISLNVAQVEKELLAKVIAASLVRVRSSVGLKDRLRTQSVATQPARPAASAPPPHAFSGGAVGVVLVGVSTGGPGTLEDILPKLPADFPWPIVVAQHMPSSFTAVFARRLNDLCALTVIEAAQLMPLQPGFVYIGKGDADVVISKRATGLVVSPVPAGRQYLWHPSVARMVESAAQVVPPDHLIGVQLTGMGDDGAEQMTEMRRRGGRTIAQDAATSVIFGMPGELVKRGGATLVLPAGRVAGQLVSWLTQGKKDGRNGAR